ncbi:TPA: gamma-mobile-trio protein GmtX [Pseudomonas aeruginosa]
MSDEETSVESVFGRLMNQATDIRRKRSLEALNTVCGLLHERGSLDFSYRNIVTLGRDRGLGVPSEKSIVNSTGKHYRDLVQAWRVTAIPSDTGGKLPGADWMESIKDPVLRMSVLMLNAELKALKARDARKAKISTAPILIGSQLGQPVSAQLRFNDSELAALRASIDPDFLRLSGMIIGSRGEIVDAAGRKVLKPGFRDAIEKILTVQRV